VAGKRKLSNFQTLNSLLWRAVEWSTSSKINEFSVANGKLEAGNLQSTNILCIHFIHKKLLIFPPSPLPFVSLTYSVRKSLPVFKTQLVFQLLHALFCSSLSSFYKLFFKKLFISNKWVGIELYLFICWPHFLKWFDLKITYIYMRWSLYVLYHLYSFKIYLLNAFIFNYHWMP
jgi:hypothetical protein